MKKILEKARQIAKWIIKLTKTETIHEKAERENKKGRKPPIQTDDKNRDNRTSNRTNV